MFLSDLPCGSCMPCLCSLVPPGFGKVSRSCGPSLLSHLCQGGFETRTCQGPRHELRPDSCMQDNSCRHLPWCPSREAAPTPIYVSLHALWLQDPAHPRQHHAAALKRPLDRRRRRRRRSRPASSWADDLRGPSGQPLEGPRGSPDWAIDSTHFLPRSLDTSVGHYQQGGQLCPEAPLPDMPAPRNTSPKPVPWSQLGCRQAEEQKLMPA